MSFERGTYDKVSKKNCNCNLTNCWNVDASMFLDLRSVEVLAAGKVDADCAIPKLSGINFVGLGRHTTDYDIAKVQTLFKGVLWREVLDIVGSILQTATTRVELDTI